jgi:D-alanyl-D-alanine dipeptidase
MRHFTCLVAMGLTCWTSAIGTPMDSATTSDSTVTPQSAQIPAEPAPELRRLIGEYGSSESLLTIYEANGQLFADGIGLQQTPLRRLTPTQYSVDGRRTPQNLNRLEFELDRDSGSVAVTLGGSRLPIRDIGQETIETIRAGVRSDAARLRATALKDMPPIEPAPRLKSDLVALVSIDSSIKFDIRYATSNNFMGFPLYEQAGAYLQRPAAEALRRVEQSLERMGYGLLVYDAYRPWFVTKMFWDATPVAAHIFVADPSDGSRHNRGCAVDLTLYDRATGKAVQMTGRYDEMSPRSYADYVGGTSRQRWWRDLLRNAMEAQGFAVYAQEWWHFDYKDWDNYAIGNVGFKALEAAMRGGAP